jgi:hypothetical protein
MMKIKEKQNKKLVLIAFLDNLGAMMAFTQINSNPRNIIWSVWSILNNPFLFRSIGRLKILNQKRTKQKIFQKSKQLKTNNYLKIRIRKKQFKHV